MSARLRFAQTPHPTDARLIFDHPEQPRIGSEHGEGRVHLYRTSRTRTAVSIDTCTAWARYCRGELTALRQAPGGVICDHPGPRRRRNCRAFDHTHLSTLQRRATTL